MTTFRKSPPASEEPMRVIRLPLVPASQKRRYLKAAESRHMKLTEFMFTAADKAADPRLCECCEKCAELYEQLQRATARIARLEAESKDFIDSV